MAKTALLALALSALVAPAELEDQSAWHGSLAEAQAEARANDGLIFVDLYAEWCGWCKQLERKVFSTEDFAAVTKGWALLRVDTDDGAEGSRLQQRFEAFDLPTILILTPDLGLAGRIEGYAPKDAYLAKIEAQLGRYREVMKAYEQSRSIDDPQRLHALARELLDRHEGEKAASLFARLGNDESFAPAERARIAFRQADAERVAGRFGDAFATLERARVLAASLDDGRLVEICDLLRIRIASEKGDCPVTRKAAETFLTAYPRSEFRRIATGTLATLDRGELACT